MTSLAPLKVLVTCPPMLGMMETFRPEFAVREIELTAAKVIQTLTVAELKTLVPQHDGWIIGDDPATRAVFEAGRQGRLKAAVKWGVGVDNVDFAACKALGIPVANTPGVFGADVADLALSYIVALARETFAIDRGVRAGGWPKPKGVSLGGKTLGLVGLGDVGLNLAQRALACGMTVVAWDPAVEVPADLSARMARAPWPHRIGEADFLAVTCSLNGANRHMLGADILHAAKRGVRIVNVARGSLIDETALIGAMQSGHVHSVALDVFETEPLPFESALRRFENCIMGSHNASNTEEGVIRASRHAMALLFAFLGQP